MEPLEFLAAVLPTSGNGYYCMVELTTKKLEHVYVQEIQELETTLRLWQEQKKDTYFALGTYGTTSSREKENAHMFKCVAIDVDCNHPKDVPNAKGIIAKRAYPSAKLAAQAILDFCEKTGLSALGEPWMVASGGGVHAYWPLSEAIPKEVWEPFSKGFSNMTAMHKLGNDLLVTYNSAGILRVPDTTNTGIKNKKVGAVRGETRVRFVSEGSVFNMDDIQAVINNNIVGTPFETTHKPKVETGGLQLAGKRPTGIPTTATAVKLFQNTATMFKGILVKTEAGVGCGQLAHYIENASDDGMEPMWRGMLSLAQKCDDGVKASKWLSKLHPYDDERMEKKLSEIKGPYPCTSIDSLNPGVCPTCTHWGKITNPLILGRETSVTTAEKLVALPTGSSEQPTKTVKRPEAPRGYAYGEHGGIFIEKEDEDAHGNVSKRLVMIIPYDLFPVDILNNNGDHMVHLMAVRPEKVQEVLFAQKAVASKEETVKHLMSQNIVAAFGSGNDVNLYNYVRACVEKMSSEKKPIDVPANYGWQGNDTFVFAGAIYTPNASPVEVPMPGLENIVMNTRPTGSIDNWRKFIHMLIRRQLWDHLAIVLAGAGSPLMRFTGLKGVTFHCASTESGTGKSLALEGAASIWGHPIHYRTGAGTSPVAMQQRLGLLHSISLITDEITTNNRADFEWFPAFLLSMTEGRGKERMESGANKERLNLSTWASNALMSSNMPAVDYMVSVRKSTAEGELRRMVEFIMDEKLEWDSAEVEIIKSLQENYAVAGDMLVQYMVDNIGLLKTLVPETVARMRVEYSAHNDERFWMAGIGTAIAAGIIMNSEHAGIVDIPLKEIVASFGKRIDVQRGNIKVGHRTAEGVLSSYIQEYRGRLVVVRYGDKASALAHLGFSSDKTTFRTEVMGRVEWGVTAGCIDLYIEERLLRAYCSNLSFSYTAFKRQLEADREIQISYIQKKDMLAKTDGPPMRVSAMRITRPIKEDDNAIIDPTVQLPLGEG